MPTKFDVNRYIALNEAERIGHLIGVNFREIDLQEFHTGLVEELEEHEDVHGNDLTAAAKITHAHLKKTQDTTHYKHSMVYERGTNMLAKTEKTELEEILDGIWEGDTPGIAATDILDTIDPKEAAKYLKTLLLGPEYTEGDRWAQDRNKLIRRLIARLEKEGGG